MFPDRTPAQAPDPASLPPIQAHPLLQAAAAQFAAAPAASASPVQATANLVEQVGRLAEQYKANPYAFNAAFQQLKSAYLAEQYHINPGPGKN